MGKLVKYAKESRSELHQYPWKVELDIFVPFVKYCESLNLSVNEALTILVKEELKGFLKEVSEESINEMIKDFKSKSKRKSKKKSKKGGSNES